ncbi:cytochrome c biogenesis protein ResB, partial [Acinetobacter baumannii]
KIVYYQPGENSSQRAPQSPVVKQYFANLSLLDARGREMRRETISVNHPMTVDDTVIYQASFNPTGKLFVKVNGKPMTVSTNTEFMNRPVSMTELGN